MGSWTHKTKIQTCMFPFLPFATVPSILSSKWILFCGSHWTVTRWDWVSFTWLFTFFFCSLISLLSRKNQYAHSLSPKLSSYSNCLPRLASWRKPFFLQFFAVCFVLLPSHKPKTFNRLQSSNKSSRTCWERSEANEFWLISVSSQQRRKCPCQH